MEKKVLPLLDHENWSPIMDGDDPKRVWQGEDAALSYLKVVPIYERQARQVLGVGG
jgi:hypothetical protein